MAQNHGARQQKRAAKQKARRSEKRAKLFRRTSTDPTIRLALARRWPVVDSIASTNLWSSGLGSLAIARRESEDSLVFAVFLVDVHCLGVKNAFWTAGTPHDFKELVRKMEQTQPVRAIDAACLVKIVDGAVEFAKSFGFPPHPDYRHASMLLDGIDPTTCPHQFTFGREGKPFYIQGPFESNAQATAIMQRIQAAGGHFVVQASDAAERQLPDSEDGLDEQFVSLEEDHPPNPDEWR
jgi:hypothetical protein